MADSTADTREHIAKVMARLHEVCDRLDARARVHDASKLEEPEKSGFDNAPDTRSMSYGQGDAVSPEYQQALDGLKDALTHHYAHNSHHPQHFPNGMDGMSLLDLVEWFCDITAAGERYKGGNLEQSLAVNRQRFGISDQLFSILENTRKELGW